MAVNSQYNVARPNSLPIRLAGHQRRKMFAVFLRTSGIAAEDTVVDIGATSDRSYHHSNYLEAWYPQKARITAVGIDDASFLEQEYPGVKFVNADGRNLPFEAESFDFAHSSAVIEHVGSAEMQTQFLRELWRVVRKGIFVTTPNRWFPMEFHTVLPLLHWLPAATYRKALAGMGKDFFAQETNLNLMSRGTFAQAARRAGIDNFDIMSVSLGGWATNLLLYAHKTGNRG